MDLQTTNGLTNQQTWKSPLLLEIHTRSFLVAHQKILLIILRTRIRRRNCVKIGVLVYSIGYIEPGQYTRLMGFGWSVATVITAKA